MRLALFVLIGSFAAFSVAHSETIYKWQDKDGVWHYEAAKPKDQQVDKVKVRRSPNAPAEAKPAEASPESPNCLRSRENLDVLNSHTTVRKDLDGDGTPETLTLEQHQQEIADAKQQIAAFCKPAESK